MSDQNLPAVQSKQIAAAQMVEKYRSEKALVFVNAEDLQTHSLFIPEVTMLAVARDEFHSFSGKLMPKSHVVDLIATASGVSFIAAECSTRKEGESTWIGRAQGKKRLPDGTWRTSEAREYEFDVETRAELDFLNDKKNLYNTDTAKRYHVLELKKFARQRASTGARLNVIRELVHIPTAFKPDDIEGGQMVFARVALNTQRMLEEPEMRNAIIKNAIGATEDIFGPQAERNVTPQIADHVEATDEQIKDAAPAEQQLEGIPGDIEIPWGDGPPPPTELEEIRAWFKMRIHELPAQKTKDWIKAVLDDPKSGQDFAVLTQYKEALERRMASAKGGGK